MGTLLKSQPLVEALCEFRFTTTEGWDLALPGLFYAEVKESFPNREAVQEVRLNLGFNPLEGGPPVVRTPQLRLWDEDHFTSLQIGEGLLAVNQLSPYSGWNNFKKLTQQTFLKYATICPGVIPKQISLRYINHIYPNDPEGFVIDEYITTMPLFPSPLDFPLISFQQSYSLLVKELESLLVHRTSIAEDDTGKSLLLLDLEFTCSTIPDFENDAEREDWIGLWLESAHSKIEDAFISSLNPSYFESLR
jgi:uncharacterized protein (TIGR04255 family)